MPIQITIVTPSSKKAKPLDMVGNVDPIQDHYIRCAVSVMRVAKVRTHAVRFGHSVRADQS